MDQYQHDGFTFTVRDHGPQDGETVVLLHGFPQDASSWHLVEPILNQAGYRTLAPDQRGYSKGAQPRKRSAYSGAQLSADVIALLDAAGLTKSHIVGHDWGGAAAWNIAGSYPDRTTSVTSISTPHPTAMQKSWMTSTQGLRSWYMLAFQVPALPEFVLGAGSSRGQVAKGLAKGGLSREMAAHSEELLADPATRRGAVNWYRGLPFSAREGIHRSRVPTAYIYGRKDPFLGPTAAHLTKDYVLGDYQYTEVDGGHWLPDTHADLVAAKIIERAQSV